MADYDSDNACSVPTTPYKKLGSDSLSTSSRGTDSSSRKTRKVALVDISHVPIPEFKTKACLGDNAIPATLHGDKEFVKITHSENNKWLLSPLCIHKLQQLPSDNVLADISTKIKESRGKHSRYTRLVDGRGAAQGETMDIVVRGHTLTVVNDVRSVSMLITEENVNWILMCLRDDISNIDAAFDSEHSGVPDPPCDSTSTGQSDEVDVATPTTTLSHDLPPELIAPDPQRKVYFCSTAGSCGFVVKGNKRKFFRVRAAASDIVDEASIQRRRALHFADCNEVLIQPSLSGVADCG